MSSAFTNSLGMSFVEIPAGSFVMGQAEGGDFDERPTHPVTVSRPFLMAVTQVTNAQYERFDPDHRALRGKLAFSLADDEAVIFVTWHDAVRFCEWLSAQDGKPYRLPTEAEWEYACRAGMQTAYHTGDSLPPEFHRNVRLSWYPDTTRDPTEVPVPLTVGATPPNPWGLQDMHGNVEEWCADWYAPYAPTDQTDPAGPADGDFKVTRGGSHSTELQLLRSANRSGTLPEDCSWIIGFRVVCAEPPCAIMGTGSRENGDWHPVSRCMRNRCLSPFSPAGPLFSGPIPYVKIPPGSEGPLFSRHNHDAAIAACPNGDLLAIWYTCRAEPGRELGIACSRLRAGATEWDPAAPFWDVPDRNDHAPALLADSDGTLYHFNGLAVAATWGALATIMRTSTDSGFTWSKARLIVPEHGPRHMPVESVLRTREGYLLLPCDACTGGQGGTAVHISRDNGLTWRDPGEGKPQPVFEEGRTGAWIAGIHAGVVQLADGSLMAFGRGNDIARRMPMSLSRDMGETWTYHASALPPVSTGQRLALLRLREGPILIVAFSDARHWKPDEYQGIMVTDADGNEFRGFGLYAALSYDEGTTWPLKKLLTPGGPAREIDGGGNTGRFTMDATHAETAGYLAITQTPDGTIQLISSRLHYRFNLSWLEQGGQP